MIALQLIAFVSLGSFGCCICFLVIGMFRLLQFVCGVGIELHFIAFKALGGRFPALRCYWYYLFIPMLLEV